MSDAEPFLEYHFHTFFDVDDSEQVALAIKLRNEIIANCVAKKIIAIPLHYHYDPLRPVKERNFDVRCISRRSVNSQLRVWKIQYLDNSDTSGLNMQPVGPHPMGSFETWVPVECFAKLYEWFVQNRGPLTIFVHPLTRHELVDHTDRVVFMGKSYSLRTDQLRKEIPDFGSQYKNLKLGYANPVNYEK